MPERRGLQGGKKEVRENKRYRLPAAKSMSHGCEMYSMGNVASKQYLCMVAIVIRLRVVITLK